MLELSDVGDGFGWLYFCLVFGRGTASAGLPLRKGAPVLEEEGVGPF